MGKLFNLFTKVLQSLPWLGAMEHAGHMTLGEKPTGPVSLQNLQKGRRKRDHPDHTHTQRLFLY